MGMVIARVVQTRLQLLAERVLPESQCCFRGGRGCTDMIFMVWQLAEKFKKEELEIKKKKKHKCLHEGAKP